MNDFEKAVGDPWGQACLDYWRTGSADHHIRRDDGHLSARSPEGYFAKELPEDHAEALRYAQGRLLDVGCGPGRHLLWLQDRGLEVTGIDNSPGAVQVARERGARDVRVLSVFDIATLEEKFDTVLFMGNNMGLAGSIEKTHALLEQLRNITTEEAVVVGHSVNPVRTDDPEHLAYHQANEAAGRYRGQVRLRLEYKGCVSPWFDLILFEPDVLANLLSEHGWEKQDLVEQSWGYFLIAWRVPV